MISQSGYLGIFLIIQCFGCTPQVKSEFEFKTNKSFELLASNWNDIEEKLFEYAKTKLGSSKNSPKHLIEVAEEALTQYGTFFFSCITVAMPICE